VEGAVKTVVRRAGGCVGLEGGSIASLEGSSEAVVGKEKDGDLKGLARRLVTYRFECADSNVGKGFLSRRLAFPVTILEDGGVSRRSVSATKGGLELPRYLFSAIPGTIGVLNGFLSVRVLFASCTRRCQYIDAANMNETKLTSAFLFFDLISLYEGLLAVRALGMSSLRKVCRGGVIGQVT